MKLNKIISLCLATLMLATSFVGLFGFTAYADDSTEISIMDQSEVISDSEKVKQICKSYLEYNFTTAAEMLLYEAELGYLDYIKQGDFAVFVNRYTGFMYYVNSKTGQILTSNPIDPAYKSKEGGSVVSLGNDTMSQLIIEYFSLSDTKVYTYDSLRWIMEGSLLSVSEYDGGIAVEYTLGNAKSSFIAPSVILYETANEVLYHPMFERLANLLQAKCGDFDSSVASQAGLSAVKSGNYNVLDNDVYRSNTDVYSGYKVNPILEEYKSYAMKKLGSQSADYLEIAEFIAAIQTIFSNYDIIIPSSSTPTTLKERIGAVAEGHTVILLDGADTGDTTLAVCRQVEKALRLTCPEYSMDDLMTHEKECGFASATVSVPAFKITLVYSLDKGDLVVSIPMNLITFDETEYAIQSITPLKMFGAGNMDNDGYVFYPDGSGTILEFDDFYYGSTSEEANTTVYIEAPVFGSDYCYSTITGAHREQIVMPVFGITADVIANDTGYSSGMGHVRNGYFAIMEQGASLATLGCESGGSVHKYISVFTEYTPYPTDTYNLSQSISVSGLGSYTVVSPASFTESIKTRFVMLVDEDIYNRASLIEDNFSGYVSDYVGMANCYRDYLSAQGVLDSLDKSYSDMPLYIEVLGSTDITKKVLSFPVVVSTPLTTFDDVARMYTELSSAKAKILAKAEDLRLEAEKLREENAEKYQAEIAINLAKADQYEELANEIVDIKNINFRLTGFTNGGMNYTYPAKVRWEKSVGGKSGFENLLVTAQKENEKDGYTFGIYPDFDFMYINDTSAFDGISNKIASCMVDNRYASKQTYNSINQKFESTFALVVSSGSLNMLYDKFIKQYSGYSVSGISVSTMGSDLNSNFDDDAPLVRESSVEYVSQLLGRMSESYSIMSDKGNSYTLKYLDHILNAPLDSSHLNNSSYAIPFYGMVLHSYVSYAGTPINYSGSPEYEMLRSIESGASLYYILCTQNTNYLKENNLLSKYYGVDYENWFDKIVEQYAILNSAVGNLQQHSIADHAVLLCERVVNEQDMRANYERLIAEFLKYVDQAISNKIDLTLKQMREDGKIGAGLVFSVSDAELESIIANAADRINLSSEELCAEFGLDASLREIIDGYHRQYSAGEEQTSIDGEDIVYKSKYKYVTDSFATDENYVRTDYTCDNGNLVMVCYEREVNGETDRVVFLLNYNIFSVKIKLDSSIHSNIAEYCDSDGYITLDSYGFVKIEG